MFAVIKLFFDISHCSCRAMRRSVCNARASNGGRSLCVQISRERSYPLPIYWYHSKGNWLRYNSAADSFWATVCKTVRPMLSVRCLPVCPVCNVGVLWPNGWTDQDETWHAGRPRPWPHCVRWGPSCPSPKRHSPPIFGPYLLRPNGCI